MVSSPPATLSAACLVLQALGSPVAARAGSRGPQVFPGGGRPSPAVPIRPLQDPWYTAPHGFAEAEPGDVLRIREAPGNLTSLARNCTAAYNILYRTTNSRYEPDWAVTTVFVPATPAASAAALLSYQVPYDSAWLDASPSYAFYTGDGAGYLFDVSTGLSSGWFVSVPDYEGPLASFTAGVQSGHATIDSIRAVFNANDTLGLADDARYAMWGYSGGALASEWAAELAVQYAPEMNFSGAALGGLTPNVTSVLGRTNKSNAVGLSPSSILGLSSQYPRVKEYIISRLKTEGPYNATRFLAALNYTLIQAARAYAGQDIGEYFIGGLADLASPAIMRISNLDGIMGYHGVPQMPLFAYKAIADEISGVADTDELVEKYCKVGANILYQRNTAGAHSEEAVNGRPAALLWLRSILGGTYAQDYPAAGCTTRVVTVDLAKSTASRRGLRNEGVWSWVDVA